jgi:anti-anti-sigma factor
MTNVRSPGTSSSVSMTMSRRDVVELHARGEFDFENHGTLISAIRMALTTERRSIILSLRQVTFIDATTVQSLLRCRGLASGLGRSLVVIEAAGLPATILDVTGAHRWLSPVGATFGSPPRGDDRVRR